MMLASSVEPIPQYVTVDSGECWKKSIRDVKIQTIANFHEQVAIGESTKRI